MRIRRIAAGVVVMGCLIGWGRPAAAQTRRLSLQQAEQQALQNHPVIHAGEDVALASGETVREAKSAYFPTVVGSLTGADALDGGTRIAAGGFNNPTILPRVAYGVAASQLVTDFGRTADLAGSARLRADATQQDVASRRAAVILQVDRAYFETLRAQAVLRVADQTVAARQLVVDQVAALAATGLKSELDLSFASVSLSEAQLLQVQARNDVQAAYAALSAALGTTQPATYELADEPLPAAPPADSATLVARALQQRPEVLRARLSQQAQAKFADAERALQRPTVSVVAAAGLTPYHQAGLTDQYAAAAFNVAMPLFNGNLFAARRAEASFLASAGEEAVRDIENQIARDVQVGWLGLQTAFQRLDVTNRLLRQATDALDLAQQRYDLGLSSIVELTQAQLSQTAAQITQAAAQYDCHERAAALRFQTGDLP
jgi:outer membrane protein